MSLRSTRAVSTSTPTHSQFAKLLTRGSVVRKLALCLLIALLVSVAQASYNWTPTLGLADNTAWCATNNCLTSIAGITVETKAGIDGTIYGLNSAHQLFTYTANAGWVLAPSALQSAGGYPLMHISVGIASKVLALNTSTGSNIYVLNSAGTAWQLLGGWLSMAEIGADGTIWGINLENSTIYTWTGSAWAAPGGLLSNIAVGSSGNVWGVNPYNQIFLYVGGSAVWEQIPVPFTPSTAENAIAAAGDMGVAVLDTSGGIHVSTDEGNTWSTIEGTASSISGGGWAMFVRGSSGVSYHVNLVVPALTNTGADLGNARPDRDVRLVRTTPNTRPRILAEREERTVPLALLPTSRGIPKAFLRPLRMKPARVVTHFSATQTHPSVWPTMTETRRAP